MHGSPIQESRFLFISENLFVGSLLLDCNMMANHISTDTREKKPEQDQFLQMEFSKYY